MSRLGGPNETLLTDLITANLPPPRRPGPPGLDRPCRAPADGLRDVTLPPPAAIRAAAHAARRAEARRVLFLAAAVVVPILTGLAETVLR